ncbi:hypothetical protein BKA82DRAFT_4009262 [Pisolithus tinctorius]|nr:hypothetical protein BKA82DRAFT_4009262 [Pisolithus tinctorius]
MALGVQSFISSCQMLIHVLASLTRFVVICKSLGLVYTRQQAHTPETIQDAMIKLREMYPNAGTREMISLIFFEHDMSVSQSTMQLYFTTYEPHLVRHCKARHLQCCQFWAAGVNDIWAVDQHDKWLRSGLSLHTGIEPFLGWILWMKKLLWSLDTLLNEGLDEGWYDPNNTLQLMVFHWLFIPWLQRELDQYRDQVNNSHKCQDKNKVLPHGIPKLIHTCAEDYGVLDFKVMVDPKTIEDVQQLYIKADHPVFNLVPHVLNAFIDKCYIQLGSLSVQHNTIWVIYLDLLSLLWQQPDIIPVIKGATSDNEEQNDDVPLIDGLQDLIKNDQYMGGLGNGMGLCKSKYTNG